MRNDRLVVILFSQALSPTEPDQAFAFPMSIPPLKVEVEMLELSDSQLIRELPDD